MKGVDAKVKIVDGYPKVPNCLLLYIMVTLLLSGENMRDGGQDEGRFCSLGQPRSNEILY